MQIIIVIVYLLQYTITIRYINNIIIRRILDLQKDRYFETLASKYWNQSLKAQCPNSDDNEGITLESLGELFRFFHFSQLKLLLTWLER